MSSPVPATLFCFGLGYTAGFLARALRAKGWRVAGTAQTEEGRARLAAAGVEAHRFDREHPLPNAAALLGAATHLLSSVPPDERGDPVLDVHGRDLAALSDLRWVGYLSTTGVYGNRDGGWVDERSTLAPTGERGRRRVAAEVEWLELQRRHGLPVHVFRLAGIYGPGRSALESVRSGAARRVCKPGQVFSRIHVKDIVQALTASMGRPDPGAIYNLCDDDPAPPEAVVEYACELLGVAPPPLVPLESAELSPMARSFYADSKRVSNARMKEVLGVMLRYPSYRDGLSALLAELPPHEAL
ncbi:MAG TPA: SDR family oxidoreductase [Stellaceae bacterium]|nr:SDR family oxidoreductase [Stellaceae bacterium]